MRIIQPISYLAGLLLTLTMTSALAGMPTLAANESDSNHQREVLEKFSIDSLRYVGTLSHEDCWDGLVQTPDNLIHRVRVGSHVGEHGRVTAITKEDITISEIVINDAGGATERTIKLKPSNSRASQRPRLLII